MGRRRRGIDIHGWLVFDKPLGMTSAAAVSKVQYLLNAKKAGHAGTLDPLATGVLPIAFGEATKTVPYIMDGRKDYAFTLQWGAETNTDDLEGDVVAEGGAVPTRSEIEVILADFTGRITQTPPAYSAVKINGERAYKRARRGEEVTMPARQVDIFDLRLAAHDEDAGQSKFVVSCGKGTYIRALGRDMARNLGGYGHLAALRRLRVGPFREKDAISLAKLEEFRHSARPVEPVLPVMTALDDIPALAVTGDDINRIRCGQSITDPTVSDGLIILVEGDQPLAIAKSEQGQIKTVRGFNL